MEVVVHYNDFIDENNRRDLRSVEAKLANGSTLTMIIQNNEVVDGEDVVVSRDCIFKLSDANGVIEIEDVVSKQDIREIMMLSKKVYEQL